MSQHAHAKINTLSVLLFLTNVNGLYIEIVIPWLR